MKKTLIFAVVALAAGIIALSVIRQTPSTTEFIPTRTNAPPPVDLKGLQAKAEQGDAGAQLELGKVYAAGSAGKVDYKEAARWYGLAATNGSADAQASLGELYQAGQGVPRDLTNAVRLFTQSAEAGSVTGQYDLSYLYEKGIGVRASGTNAAKWARLAAEGGDPLAQYDIGQRYFVGLGVAKDPVEGLKWLLLSGGQGQSDAVTRATAEKKGMTSEQIKEGEGRAKTFIPRANSARK